MSNTDITANLPSIASSAMLGSLNISVWEGRKKDKSTEAEITASKGAASSRAASVHKHLLPESPALEAIKTLRGEARVWFNRVTLPWDDNGNRVVTTKQYFEIINDIGNYEKRFNQLVSVFLTNYNTEISKQAFELGALFNRSDYPTVEWLRERFRFTFNVNPLPMSGHFMVDINQEALKELRERCERDTQQRLQIAMQDAWNRIKEQVEWIRDRMDAVLEHNPDTVDEKKTYNEDGTVKSVEIVKKRRPKIHESMLDQGLELCSLLQDLNVTNDPKLTEARQMLERALVHVDIDSLKESKEVQQKTKSAMDEILNKFNFGI